MKKLMILFLAFVLVLAFSSCNNDSEADVSDVIIFSEPDLSFSASEIEEPDKFMAGLIYDINLPDSFIEPANDYASQKVVYDSDVAMTSECKEIYDKYVSPADIILSDEFSEDEIPFKFLSRIYYECEYLDYNILGVEKSGFDLSESAWIDAERAEESLCRWLPWKAEDIRSRFEYDSETSKYLLAAAGGGPIYFYVTDFEYPEEDILRIYFSEYDGYTESEPYPVTSSFVCEIRLNDDGSWTYLSNKKTDKVFSPLWYSDDVSFGAGYEEWNYAGTSKYIVLSGNEMNRITINGSLAHKMYFDEKPCCFFLSLNGLWVYGFDSFGLRHVSELPSEYEGIHFLKNVWIDSEERIIISYAAENCFTEIAVLDYETFEVINYIDTGILGESEVDIPFGLKPETVTDGMIEIYDSENQAHKYIDYLN